MSTIIDKINKEQEKTDIPDFRVGDSVKVHCLVKEGEKERVQIFAGLVIARRGGEVVSRGKVRRAKLHYLRDRVGKRALLVKSAERKS